LLDSTATHQPLPAVIPEEATPGAEAGAHTRWLALPRLLLIAAVVTSAAWFVFLTFHRFWAFEARALDMGNLHQAIWNTAHGDWFRQTNQPGAISRLSLHVEPILLPIAALFRLFPRVEFLLLLQAIVVALGALPLYLIAERLFAPTIGSRRAAWLALPFARAWLAMPALQGATWYEFHPVTLAPTFFVAAFWFLLRRRAGWFALFAVLAAACKEDLGLIVFLLGLYGWVATGQRRLGLITMALGLGWSLLAVLGIQGGVGGNIHWGRYDWLGDAPGAILRTLLTRPIYVAQHVLETGALRYIVELLAPVAFLSLLAPEVLLLALPSLGVNLLADFPPMHQVDTLIYAAPIAPFVALSAVVGTARLLRWATRRSEAPAPARRGGTIAWAVALLLAAAIVSAQVLWGYYPGGANARLFRPSAHDARAAALLAQIGRDEGVSAQDKLNPHTAGRFLSYIYPRVDDVAVGDADLIFVDVTGPAWPQHPNDLYADIQARLGAEFGVAAADDGYLLLRRGEPERALPPSFYTPWRQGSESPLPSALPPGDAPVRFGDALELLGVDVATDEHGEVVVQSQWRALRPIEEPLALHFIYLDPAGARPFDSQFYPPVVTLWYPVTEWEPGERVHVATLPWALEGDSLGLQVGVYAGDDPAGGALPPEGMAAPWLAEDGRMLNMGLYQRAEPRGRSSWMSLVAPWPPVASAEAAIALEAAFGAAGTPQLTLEAAEVGARLVISGAAALPVTLQWRAAVEPAADYNVFVHLLDASGAKVAQWDGPPRQGYASVPTSTLAAGDRLTGSLPLTLPDGLRGDFTLVAGLYDWQSGAPLTLPTGETSVEIATVRLP
jgi:uncharacterized membrane protein